MRIKINEARTQIEKQNVPWALVEEGELLGRWERGIC
jgi:hypothetical protein